MMDNEIKRLFFGIEALAPWPDALPQGRLLDLAHRHMTLAFLGETDFSKLSPLLSSFPKPSFKVGMAGIFDQCLFLPEKHPHVVAWHVNLFEGNLASYQKTCAEWLQEKGFDPHTKNEFLPHVTICRSPFNTKEWQRAFQPLPVIFTAIHLYESVGQLKYQPIWTYALQPSFEEMDHTADLAFKIRGESIQQLSHHAKIALAFKFPALLPYLSHAKCETVDDIIVALNAAVTQADVEVGCPIKAVSLHGEIIKLPDNSLEWEMIVDV